MVKYIVNFMTDGAHALSPCLFKAIQGLAGSCELFGGAGSIRAGFFLQFQDEGQISLRRRLEGSDGSGPIDGAIVGRKMFVLLAMIVVEVDGGKETAERRETFFKTLFFGEFGKVRVADIEIETQAGETGLVGEGAEISGITHFAGGVFNADGDAGMARVQDQMLERAEGSVAFSRVG